MKKATLRDRPFCDFTYSRKDHLALLDAHAKSRNLLSHRDPLKAYQDQLVLAFLDDNVPPGSRILDVGGGFSRVVECLKNTHECWVIDKLEGVGNGPTQMAAQGYRLVLDYIGNMNRELPDGYFDCVFSISALEHVPSDGDGFYQRILADLDRVLKPGCPSLHLLDSLAKRGGGWTHPLLPYLFQHAGAVNTWVPLSEISADPQMWGLPREKYVELWQPSTNREYEDFGVPFSYNLLWYKR